MYVIGPAMLSASYDDDHKRGRALGHALSGITIGLMIGPVYGGFMYRYVGKMTTFFVLAIVTLIDGRKSLVLCISVQSNFFLVLRLVVITPAVSNSPSSTTISFWTLARDPHVLVAIGKMIY